MQRAFQRLNQFLHIVVTETGRQSQGPGMNQERLGRGFRSSHQPHAKKMVHSGFEGSAGTAEFLAQELGDVVIEGKSGSHITMLTYQAS